MRPAVNGEQEFLCSPSASLSLSPSTPWQVPLWLANCSPAGCLFVVEPTADRPPGGPPPKRQKPPGDSGLFQVPPHLHLRRTVFAVQRRPPGIAPSLPLSLFSPSLAVRRPGFLGFRVSPPPDPTPPLNAHPRGAGPISWSPCGVRLAGPGAALTWQVRGPPLCVSAVPPEHKWPTFGFRYYRCRYVNVFYVLLCILFVDSGAWRCVCVVGAGGRLCC